MVPTPPQPKRTPWTRENTFAVVGLFLTALGIIVALTLPEVRHFLRLDQLTSSAQQVASPRRLNPALNSSGAMFGYDVQHTHFNPHEHLLSPTNVSHLVPYWTASTGDAIPSSPAVANGVIYVGSWDHKLYAFNASTGATLWTASTGNPIFSSPAVANGVVYVSANDGKLYAFNASSGVSLWTASTGGLIYYSSPTVANGVVYVGSYDHKLYAFNASSGATLWSISTGDRIDSSPTVANGVVYIGSEDHKLYTFHLPGTTS